MSNESIPPVTPAPKSGGNTILIIVVAVVVLCCLCTAVTGGGAAALALFNRPARVEVMPTVENAEPVFNSDEEQTPTEEMATQEEETAEPTETEEPTETAEPDITETPEPTETVSVPQTSGPGMGVSRDEMMRFFNAGGAIKWADPMKVSGIEMVQGTHSGLCVQSDCAVVTLAGPADNLLAVSLAVPLSKTDASEKLTAITLLMTAMARFTDEQGVNQYPGELLTNMDVGMKSGKTVNKSFENNGYKFVESYDPKTSIGALGISRPK